MIKRFVTLGFLLSICGSVWATSTPITGTVEAKCAIFTTVNPKYGNPNPYTLTTLPASGGTEAILRTDVLAADYFDLLITHPNSFSSSPTLTDSIGFSGASVVNAVGVSGMSVYETNKLVVNNTTRFRLLLAGATWFKVSSVMVYGATDTTALPAGNYTSLITATCLAR
jgi:hypothetical protein|tara:strand:+ start:56 stop:562 length:507 start_codon:yes stop_codon:yes gene_type:complete